MRTRALSCFAAILVALAGCGGGPTPDGERVIHLDSLEFQGSDSTCQRLATRGMTRPFQTIDVEDGAPVVEPDRVVQPPGAGIMVWSSADYSWEVRFENGESPLADSVYRGGPGDTVWAAVEEAVPCNDYKYMVRVWGGELRDTLELDPNGMIEPYTYRR
jgi:hypothetical protein